MGRVDELWQGLHDLFDTNDGSLPEIRLDFPDPAELVQVYELLLRRAESIYPEGAEYYLRDLEELRQIDRSGQPAADVIGDIADSFHILLEGIRASDVKIPDLGLFVFPDQLALDYRMGPDWGPQELRALFNLLAEVCELHPQVSIRHEIGAASSQFQAALKVVLAKRAETAP